MAKPVPKYTGAIKYAETYFSTEEYKSLGIHDQASQIMEHTHLFPKLSDDLMEQLSTTLIKAMCICRFLDFVPDGLTGADNISVSRKHTPSCPALRIPVIEDLSISQIQRRQKREVLFDHRHLLIIEENSSRVKRKEKHTNAE
jgi:hypothetical protein